MIECLIYINTKRRKNMKKFFALLVSMLILATSALAAKAAAPVVMVDGRTLEFSGDQAPVIESDRLFVPVRRVLERMGTKVDWDDATKTVRVTSYDNTKIVTLTIGNPVLTLHTYTSVLSAEKTEIVSDVAPVIMESRTMLPIRVIAEALGATVYYDGDTHFVNITTEQSKFAALRAKIDPSAGDFMIADAFSDKLPKLSISSDAKDIKEGDEIKVKVKLADIDKAIENAKVSSTTVTLSYNPENFELSDFMCIADGEARKPQLSAANPEFTENSLKIITLDLPDNAYLPAEDGTILEISLVAKNSEGGEFALSDGISSLGSNCELLLTTGGDDYYTYSDFDELFIDTTPITVK